MTPQRIHQRLRVANVTALIALGCLTAVPLTVSASAEPAPADAGTTTDAGLDPHAGLIYGATSCASSGCHGGAGEQHFQHAIWSTRDPHSRAYATLTTARSARMGEALGIADPATDPSCTTCHAPTQAVATLQPSLLAPDARATEGVSCVSCHGPGGDWVRGHTRTDLDHGQKVAGGLRDLRDLHARADTCVACHQNIDPRLISVGRHPRLIFELDGQTATQPRHWVESPDNAPAQAWLVGQAVALREMSHALDSGTADPQADGPRLAALHWLLAQAGALPSAAADPAALKTLADQLARDTASRFDASRGPELLARLAATHARFGEAATSRSEHAYRAERLVLALDRLLAADPAARQNPAASEALDGLFVQVQSLPGFAPEVFARQLEIFARTLP